MRSEVESQLGQVIGWTDDNESFDKILDWLHTLQLERPLRRTYPRDLLNLLGIISGYRAIERSEEDLKDALSWVQKVQKINSGQFSPVVLYDLVTKKG